MSRSLLRTSLLLAGLGILLAGCVSPGEQRAADDGRCRSYGFRPNTDAFSNCLQNIDLDRSADRRSWNNGYGYGYGGGVGFGYGPGFRRGIY